MKIGIALLYKSSFPRRICILANPSNCPFVSEKWNEECVGSCESHNNNQYIIWLA